MAVMLGGQDLLGGELPYHSLFFSRCTFVLASTITQLVKRTCNTYKKMYFKM